MTKKTIIFAAGGTGGHLFPAIAMIEQLNQSGHNLHLIIDKRCEKFLLKEKSITQENIHIVDIYLNFSSKFGKIKALFLLIKAIIQAFFILKKLKPDLVIGFGGYPSFPSLFAAKIIKIPIIIHEQNCFLGKTNKFFAEEAKYIMISYDDVKNLPKIYQNKTVKVGNIVRNKIAKLPIKDNFNSEIFHLFIFGGSQSAKILGEFMPKVIKVLKNKHPNIKLKITQQVSQNDLELVKAAYLDLKIPHKLAEFFFDMDTIYQESDLVIARAGASTISELSTIGLPAIFIPLPSAADNHQYYNAKALEDKAASWCMTQENLDEGTMADKLYELITCRELLKKTSKNLLSQGNNGNIKFKDTILKIIT